MDLECSAIVAMEFSPDDVLLATGSRNADSGNAIITIWDVGLKVPLMELVGHVSTISVIYWATNLNEDNPEVKEDGNLDSESSKLYTRRKILASGSNDGTIIVWDIRNGKVIKKINAGNTPIVSIMMPNEFQVISVASDHTIKIWSVDSARSMVAGLVDIPMTDSMDLRLIGENQLLRVMPDGAEIWRHDPWTQEQGIKSELNKLPIRIGPSDNPQCNITEEFDGWNVRILSSKTDDPKARSYVLKLSWLDTSSNSSDSPTVPPNPLTLLDKFKKWEEYKPKANNPGVTETPELWKQGKLQISAKFKEDENQKADTTRMAFDIEPQRISNLVKAADLTTAIAVDISTGVPDLVLAGTKDGQVIYSTKDNPKNPKSIKVHDGIINYIAISFDGNLVATCAGAQVRSRDKSIKILIRLEIQTGKYSAILKWEFDYPARVVEFTPDNEHLAIGTSDGVVRLCNIKTGEVTTFTAHSGAVTALSISQDGGILASGSLDKTIRLWSLDQTRNHLTLKGHKKGISSLAFVQVNSKELLVSRSKDGNYKYWDPITGLNVESPKDLKESEEKCILVSRGQIQMNSTIVNVECDIKIPGSEPEALVVKLSDIQTSSEEAGWVIKRDDNVETKLAWIPYVYRGHKTEYDDKYLYIYGLGERVTTIDLGSDQVQFYPTGMIKDEECSTHTLSTRDDPGDSTE
ncbi:WD40-repeat-containing domain protein [Polychytrium aggregatum]|uniref:WD40-repeat-containing domain protein n=1 Tax=Polychytrium aggregatum TaxID=110093 RepID=UPI0022FF3E26|nr:WD40-repeat-containing domain protein [Polychytrium aggregatum]KAI9202511.1 WD40-repeat-containing domain protein [Polychytrium aggregatum]